MDLGAWVGAATVAVIGIAVVAVLFGVVVGIALASYGRFSVVVGVVVAVVPVVGPLVLAIVAIVRGIRASRADHRSMSDVARWAVRGAERRSRIAVALVPAVAAVGLLLLVVVPVVTFTTEAHVPVSVSVAALPHGLVAVLLSALVVVAAGVLALRRPTRVGALVAVAIGAFWSTISTVLLAFSGPILALLSGISAVRDLPYSSVVLDWLSSAVPSIAGAVGAASESLTARLGAAPWLALGAGVALEGWALTEMLIARSAASAQSDASPTREPHSGPIVVTSSAPPDISKSGPSPDEFRWL